MQPGRSPQHPSGFQGGRSGRSAIWRAIQQAHRPGPAARPNSSASPAAGAGMTLHTHAGALAGSLRRTWDCLGMPQHRWITASAPSHRETARFIDHAVHLNRSSSDGASCTSTPDSYCQIFFLHARVSLSACTIAPPGGAVSSAKDDQHMEPPAAGFYRTGIASDSGNQVAPFP